MANKTPAAIFNRLLGAWYIVTGPHQFPLGGPFKTKGEAEAWIDGQVAAREGVAIRMFGGAK
jgi:hypothetical protein